MASLAGVSQRTVSNVVRGYVHVRPETRDRVQRAIDELRYRPHASARSLRDGRTGIIALAVPEIAAPYFAELADHIQRIAASRDITLLMDQTGADRQRELLVLDGYRTHVIDGLILSPTAIDDVDLGSSDVAMPTVLLGERIRGGRVVSVAIDNVVAAREAVGHLITTGRRRIAAVGALGPADGAGPARGRLQGYALAHQDAGLEPDPSLVILTGNWAGAAGYHAVDTLVRRGESVDGLFCFNDTLALGAIRALTDHGLRVPADVSVMGWDDIEGATYSTPSLTSVSPDKAAIAQAAFDALMASIAGTAPTVQDIVCRHQLIVRESTTR